MKLKRTRTKGDRWCTVEVTIENGRFSMTGMEGSILSPKQAKRDAFRYWVQYFEETPGGISDMRKRFPKSFKGWSPRAAARFVLDADGEYHGLDVVSTGDKGVFACDSAGQIRETINEYFPELATFWKWHCNDLHAECEHQEARGEKWTTNPGAICPQCGWKLGHGWAKRELPIDIEQKVKAVLP